MHSALQVAHKAYLRLTSAIGPIPLTLLVSLIAVTAIAWAFTLYPMGASIGTAMREMEGMAMEDMAMDGMSGGWSFAELLVFVTVWTIMMVAMMLPAAAPMILIFAALSCSGGVVNRYRIAGRKWRPSTPLACLSVSCVSHLTAGFILQVP